MSASNVLNASIAFINLPGEDAARLRGTALKVLGLPSFEVGANTAPHASGSARVGLFANLSYQHAEYRNGTTLAANARPVRSPDVTGSAGATYDYPIPAAGIILQPSANVSYRSSYDIESASLLALPGLRVAGYALVNAALTMKTDDNNWQLSVECANCFDKAAGQSALLGYTYLNAPRTWLVRARRDVLSAGLHG